MRRWKMVLGTVLAVGATAAASSAAVLLAAPAIAAAALAAGVSGPVGILASHLMDHAFPDRASGDQGQSPRDVGSRRRETASPKDQASSAAELAVRIALAEYISLRQDVLSSRQYMATASALTLVVIFLTVLATTAGHLGGIEADILLVATALILVLGVALIAGAAHVRAVSTWLEHIGEQVRRIVAVTYKPGFEIPNDLLGWQSHSSAVSEATSNVSVAESLVWLQVIGVPLVAYIFQAIAWWDFLTGRTDQPVVTLALLLADMIISTVYYRAFVSQARRLGRAKTNHDSARRAE